MDKKHELIKKYLHGYDDHNLQHLPPGEINKLYKIATANERLATIKNQYVTN